MKNTLGAVRKCGSFNIMCLYFFTRRTVRHYDVLIGCDLNFNRGYGLDIVTFSNFRDYNSIINAYYKCLRSIFLSSKTGKPAKASLDSDGEFRARIAALQILSSNHPEVIQRKIWEF